MTKEDYFKYIQDLNDRITKLTDIRNQAELECITNCHFTDYPAFEATYLRWQRQGGI